MYRLYRDGDIVVLPDGNSYSSDDLKNRSGYSMLFSLPCAIELNGGVMVSYQPVSSLASRYGVPEDSDPEKTVASINAYIEKIRKNNVMSFSMETAIRFAALSFTDEQALEVADLYPEYEVDHAYKKDDRFQYNGSLYKVNQNHTSAAQWVPGEVGTESLYTNLMLNDAGYQIWKQPTGAHDAYNIGDIVEYKGTLYKSLINGNVWAPDAYPQGWQEYDASTSTEPSTPDPGTETPTKPSEPEYPDFVQPTGAHDAYKKGDIVRYNGKLYQSLIDGNAYSPDAYPQGWQEYSEE